MNVLAIYTMSSDRALKKNAKVGCDAAMQTAGSRTLQIERSQRLFMNCAIAASCAHPLHVDLCTLFLLLKTLLVKKNRNVHLDSTALGMVRMIIHPADAGMDLRVKKPNVCSFMKK